MNLHHNDKNGNSVTTGTLQPLPTREKDVPRLYGACFQNTPTGAADYFGYVENKGSEDLVVLVKSIFTTAAERVTIESTTPGVPAGPTTVAIFAKRLGDANLPITQAIVQTGVDLNSAAGLITTGAVTVLEHQTPANTLGIIREKFTLAPGRALQFLAATGTTAIRVNLDLWYE